MAVVEEIHPCARLQAARPRSNHLAGEIDEICGVGTHRSKQRVAGAGPIAHETRSTLLDRTSRRPLAESNTLDSTETEKQEGDDFPIHGADPLWLSHGNGNEIEFDVPRLLRKLTTTLPWAAPWIKNGKRIALKLPSDAPEVNHASKSDLTSNVIVEPKTEQPVTSPQPRRTAGLVSNLRENVVTSRMVDSSVMTTAKPFCVSFRSV